MFQVFNSIQFYFYGVEKETVWWLNFTDDEKMNIEIENNIEMNVESY